MNHTTNYNLNQWEADDKVRRVDFNADNAKIDAAINDLRTRETAQVLKDITMSGEANYFLLDLQDIDWTRWRTVIAVARPVFNADASYMTVTLSGSTQETAKGASSGAITVLMHPMYQPDLPIVALCMGTGVTCVTTSYVFQRTTLLFQACGRANTSPALCAGSRFQAYGIR